MMNGEYHTLGAPLKRGRTLALAHDRWCLPREFTACIVLPGETLMAKSVRKIAVIALVSFLSVMLAVAQSSAPPAAAKASPVKATAGSMDDVVQTLFAATTFSQAVISPDGKQVAWVESTKSGSAIYVSEVATVKPRRITAGGSSEDGVAWSPDSRQIAFLSDAGKPDQQQLYVVAAPGGAPRKLTSVKGFLAAPGWSPDGKTLALLFTENAERAAGPLVLRQSAALAVVALDPIDLVGGRAVDRVHCFRGVAPDGSG